MELFFKFELFVFSYYNLRLLKQFSYLKTSRNINKNNTFTNHLSNFQGMANLN